MDKASEDPGKATAHDYDNPAATYEGEITYYGGPVVNPFDDSYMEDVNGK